jgi:hypothetical protein
MIIHGFLAAGTARKNHSLRLLQALRESKRLVQFGKSS